MPITREDCAEMDRADPLREKRELFELPEGLIYLDGNSLGAPPRSVAGRMREVVEREWGRDLIASWTKNDWIALPARVGARIARLIGAEADEVICADSTSVNLFKLAAGAVKLQAPRRVVVSEAGNFPTDLYILQGLAEFLGEAVELRIVESGETAGALDGDTALLLLTHVHYKTGAVHDMAALSARAREVGALTLWDLSHSAGAMDVRLNEAGADLATGCGYKYLNGGPGAPAFLYVAKSLQERLRTPLSGWMGHARPFDFVDEYEPGPGMLRGLCGTPAVLAMSALDEALKAFDGVSMAAVRAKSQRLGDLFLTLVEQHGLQFELGCPREAEARGSQVSLRHPNGYAIMQALIDAGVVGDFRAPDVLRFGFAPLYVRYADVWEAVERLAGVMSGERWREARFHQVAAVT